jgi:hypothetical protein
MEDYWVFILVVFSLFTCWLILRCTISVDTNEHNNEHDNNNNIRILRQEYRNQLIEMTNNQYNLKDTDYEIDRKIIHALQEKYKIKINYNNYYKTKKFVLKKNNHDKHCIICLQNYEYQDKVSFMECEHKFHYNCLKTWLNENPSCPICREDVINDDNNILINNGENILINYL